MEEINKAYATFRERDRIASLGGGVEKIEKQHESGKMTARERIEMLLDKGTFVELDKLMVHRCTNYGMDKNKIPGDGIVSGYGKIDGRQVFVYAYDFTVYGGSLSASNAKKIVKVQQLALKNGAPIIALNDSGGARIQEGIESLSGYADIFYQNTMASGVIPQISAILGPCAGGACYSPALTDFIFMVKEKSHMFVTGPDVVKTVIHEEVSKEELGGAMTHSSKSGVTHFMCNTEEELLMSIRELLSFLPQNNMDETKKQNCTRAAPAVKRVEQAQCRFLLSKTFFDLFCDLTVYPSLLHHIFQYLTCCLVRHSGFIRSALRQCLIDINARHDTFLPV